jgi:hypothetical protein
MFGKATTEPDNPRQDEQQALEVLAILTHLLLQSRPLLLSVILTYVMQKAAANVLCDKCTDNPCVVDYAPCAMHALGGRGFASAY